MQSDIVLPSSGDESASTIGHHYLHSCRFKRHAESKSTGHRTSGPQVVERGHCSIGVLIAPARRVRRDLYASAAGSCLVTACDRNEEGDTGGQWNMC